MKYWSDKHRTLYNGNCRSMSELANESIQCCVTSPPYWGLRKYAGEQYSIWGGTPDCSHEWTATECPTKVGKQGMTETVKNPDTVEGKPQPSNTCSLCGAWRGAYGLEPSPQMYVQHTVEILREIRRVLKKDGVIFWNCDDSYYSSPSNQQGKGVEGSGVGVRGCQGVGRVKLPRHDTLKPKDLCLIPFRVAIAAQEDGWYVRSVIIWSKPNPMPESVTDRPTGSHEYILMLTKRAKYYWDMEAVREESVGTWNSAEDWSTRQNMTSPEITKGIDLEMQRTRGLGTYHPDVNRNGRNLRNVWTFPTQPYREAHFATFPEALPEKCIKAATPEVGCCSKCGTAWERIVESKSTADWETRKQHGATGGAMDTGANQQQGKGMTHDLYVKTKTLGWQPGCNCNADKVPSTVLDCFCGSGTTLEVAAKLGRKAVGYEISEEYCRLIVERNNQSVLL